LTLASPPVAGIDPQADRDTATHRSEIAVLATAACLNVLVSGALPERYYVPAGLAAGALASGIALMGGVSLAELGLGPRSAVAGAGFGVALALPVSAGILAGARFGHVDSLYEPSHFEGWDAGRACYEVMLRTPFGTALPEEMIFRGALLALASRSRGPAVASARTSALFGVWHMLPTIARLQSTTVAARRPARQRAAWVLLSMAVTAAAGLALAALRQRSGSLIAPWLVHWAANAAGFAAAWLATRRTSETRAA
jgi:membrane protease YdiL (CAAX protease family)